jgi:nitrilase
MKPTHMERTIFGDASGDCLASVVKLGTTGGGGGVSVGGLSCWEHIQPLLKYYTFSQGEQVHVAAWPPLDACPDESPGLWSMSADGESFPLLYNLIFSSLRPNAVLTGTLP